MKSAKAKEFERLINRFARENDCELRIRQPGTSHVSIKLVHENVTVATIVMVAGRKDLSPGVFRSILKALKTQAEGNKSAVIEAIVNRLIDELTRWIR